MAESPVVTVMEGVTQWQAPKQTDPVPEIPAVDAQFPLAPACYLKTGFASWWVHSQKTQPRQRVGEGRIYHLQQVRRTSGIFPKVVSPQTAKLGKF